jgi:single-stranded-DNA-specific exonuclease
MTTWRTSPLLAIPPDLLAKVADPLLAQLLAQRGLTSAAAARAFLDPAAYRPAPPEELPDLAPAVARLRQAIAAQERICVWGDFDVDGQTSTALLVSVLRDLGARVRYFIPHRLTESHGIKLPALQRQLAEGLDLLLTCDTGVAEHEALAAAQAAGVTVIVTDHHDLPDRLPPALAVINPKRLPPDHPLRELPGVGVAWKLAEALDPDLAAAQLDLVALGIVADIAHQTGDTRYLLQRGLVALQTTPRPGLHALLESANLKVERLTEDHIGFWLAPRLNALGRLDDANLAVELLTTPDLTQARIIALRLEALNEQRKLLVDRVVVQALGQLADTPSLAEYNAIVLTGNDWHPGVIGIAASRVGEQYRKPVILITLRPDALGRGSARSVPGCDIHAAIKSQAHLLRSFGGHPMAAGLALKSPDVLADFRGGISDALGDCRPPEKSLTVDALVTLPQISMELLRTIQRLAPFGAGNPPVLLGVAGVRIAGESAFGKTRTHARVTIEDESGEQREVIWWRGATEPSPAGQFDLAFSLGPDDFKGGDAIQLEWRAAREWEPAPPSPKPVFLDYRQTQLSMTNDQLSMGNDQLSIPNSAFTIHNSVIWAEGIKPGLPAVPRHKLYPARSLVVWTAPPGQDIFQQVVAVVRPEQIVLVVQPSSFDAFGAFVNGLMGGLKFAIAKKSGEIMVEELAATLGHRAATVRLGIKWLEAQGKVRVDVEEDELLVVRPAASPPRVRQSAAIEQILQATLAETAAYRDFFRRAGLTTLERMLD